MAFIIKQGDTSPSLTARLVTADNQPANLAGASVIFHFRKTRGGASAISASAAIVDAATGSVRYDWQAGDTANFGEFEGEFEVTYADGNIETFPNEGYIDISVSEQIA